MLNAWKHYPWVGQCFFWWWWRIGLARLQPEPRPPIQIWLEIRYLQKNHTSAFSFGGRSCPPYGRNFFFGYIWHVWEMNSLILIKNLVEYAIDILCLHIRYPSNICIATQHIFCRPATGRLTGWWAGQAVLFRRICNTASHTRCPFELFEKDFCQHSACEKFRKRMYAGGMRLIGA